MSHRAELLAFELDELAARRTPARTVDETTWLAVLRGPASTTTTTEEES